MHPECLEAPDRDTNSFAFILGLETRGTSFDYSLKRQSPKVRNQQVYQIHAGCGLSYLRLTLFKSSFSSMRTLSSCQSFSQR